MRSKNSAINTIVNILGQILSFLAAIIMRAVLARTLPEEYLGVNSLFSNILSILSLAELGVGTAMIYAIYKPVADDDHDKIARLINLYGLMYKVVALVVSLIGLALIPFLDILIKDASSVDNLVLIYLLYLLQSVTSYLCVYKTAILTANQKQYIFDFFTLGGQVLMRVLQIVVLLITKSYIAFMIVYVVCSFLPNLFATLYAEKKYPYIKINRRLLPSKEERAVIFKNIRALFIHKIGAVVVYHTDNLIMSGFLGLVACGVYSNYVLVSQKVGTMITAVFTSCSASIGNLAATEGEDHVKRTFEQLFMLNFMLFGLCTVALAGVFPTFITFVYGEKFLMTDFTVALLLISFYMSGMRTTASQFRNAMGVFSQDKWRVIPEALLNLIISIALVGPMGIAGIIAGTVISMFVLPFWIEPLYLFKYGFKDNKGMFTRYCLQMLARTALTAAATALTWWVCSLLPNDSFIMIIIKGLISVAIFAVLFLIFYGRSWQFKSLLEFAKKLLFGLKRQSVDKA